jgi:preprotein translocase subunit SecE
VNDTNTVNVATNAVANTAAQSGSTDYLPIIIGVVIVGVIFAFLWRKGYLLRIRGYIAETQEELRKCTWPSVDELKGSTLVVMVTIALLGAFTVGVDYILSNLIRFITS